MKKGLFICFVGIDGSGKTTLTKNIVGDMHNAGIDFLYRYCRYEPLLLKPFILLARRTILSNENVYQDYKKDSNTKKSLFSNLLFSRIYEKLVLLDYSVQIIFQIMFPLYSGRNIVCDRYIYDTILTDLSVDLNYSNRKTIDLLDFCFKIFPRPDITFLIDISEIIAFQRKNDVPSLDYLIDRRKKYLSVIHDLDFYVLNGEKNPDIVKCEAIQKIMGLCTN